MSQLIDHQIYTFKARIEEITKNLQNLASRIGHDDLMSTISELRTRLHEPFMFVIVGEVKAGKSSFVNALLQSKEEICKVGPAPTTDVIQQIVYGDKMEILEVNQYLRKIFNPAEILKEISIVDTPGTNTIVEHHQEITERFIPSSDLVVFVFEAKNPYRQSSWTFFDFIKAEWQRKVIFVLQQKDLLSAEDLEVNIQGVRDMAHKKNLPDPQIFATSAKAENEGNFEDSGFEELRTFISTHITGGKAPFLKLLNTINTSENIHQRIRRGLDDRQAQYDADREFREDIRFTLDDQEKKSYKQADILIENIVAAYDRTTRDSEIALEEGLSFPSLLKRSFSSIFNRKESAANWLKNLVKELEENMNRNMLEKLNSGVSDLADSIQQMAKIIDLKIKNSRTILNNNHDIFSDIAERRIRVLSELEEAFHKFLSKSENFDGGGMFPATQNLAPSITTGSGLAVIGIILAAVTNTTIFDVTGGILTTIGILFAGVTTGIKRRKILNAYKLEINTGRERLETEAGEKLKAYINNLKSKIEFNFNEFDQMLAIEASQLIDISELHLHIGVDIESTETELDKVLAKM
ncbi:MAG: dynamin family protein [Saprospiraceae bacterium]